MRRAAVLAALLVSGTAAAAPVAKERPGASKAACVAAHEQAQSLRTEKKLHAARDKFVLCARADCPVVLRKECAEQMEALEVAAPSVALEALDDKGASDPNVKVSLDGRVLAERLTGASTPVEPGEHVFRFERASDGKALEQRVLVLEGERNRKVVGDFQTLLPPRPVARREETTPAPAAPPEPRRIPALAWVAGGVGVAALGSFAFFSLDGRSKEDDLVKSCAPSCTGDDVAPIERSYLIGDISLVVAIAGLVTAAVLAVPALTAPRAQSSAVAGSGWLVRTRVR